MILERNSISGVVTLNPRPRQAERSKLGKSPKTDQKSAAQAKRGGEKGKTFFRQPTGLGQETVTFFPKNCHPKMANQDFPASQYW